MRVLSPPAIPDVIAPSVYFTSPGANSNVANTITIQALGSDNYGIAGMQYQIDGANIGGEVGYGGSVGLDTHMYGNGWHTLTAIARDVAGNRTSTSISINVTNSAPGAGIVSLGDHALWNDDGYYDSYRHSPPAYDDSAYGNWIWSATNAKYAPVYLPGNPNPTYYQMRVWLHGERVEGGSDNVINSLDLQVGGVAGWTTIWQQGPTWSFNMGPLWNVGGGNDCYAHWYCSYPGWNNCFCQGIGFYYDFVPKYAS